MQRSAKPTPLCTSAPPLAATRPAACWGHASGRTGPAAARQASQLAPACRCASLPRSAASSAGSGPAVHAAAPSLHPPPPSPPPPLAGAVEDTNDANWRAPLRRSGSVVALGKFDALHRGHQALATAAATMLRPWPAVHATPGATSSSGSGSTTPSAPLPSAAAAIGAPASNGSAPPPPPPPSGEAVLLSFSGMGEVLGWPSRLPLTAPQDRPRVLAGWAPACGGTAPSLRTMPFGQIRSMPPEAFVALLAHELGAAGVVAGRNYRFGFKAAGDAELLVQLGHKYGMAVTIVDLLALPEPEASSCSSSGGSGGGADGAGAGPSANGDGQAAQGAAKSGDCPRVSSSKIRSLLESGRVERVEQLLGRKYRLVCELSAEAAATTTATAGEQSADGRAAAGQPSASGQEGSSSSSSSSSSTQRVGDNGWLDVPRAAYQNQPPANGSYRALVGLVRSPGGGGDPGPADCLVEYPLGVDAAAAGGAEGPQAGAVALSPVCVTVELRDEGLRVRLGREGVAALGWASREQAAWLLTVDFDACG